MTSHLSPAEIRYYYTAHAPQLREVGGELRAPCPLHHGRHDSFAVDAQGGRWEERSVGEIGWGRHAALCLAGRRRERAASETNVQD
jgi:hypothetical protein